jgi:hypothetical protein
MTTPDRVPGLLLVGTIGSGKTALGTEVGQLCATAGVSTAVIDLDWLGWLSSKSESGDAIHRLIVRNLAFVWPNFKAAGAQRLILMRTLGSRSETESVRAAVPDVDLTIVRLAVSRDVIVDRLRNRDSGQTLETHLEESERFAAALESEQFEDLVIEAEVPVVDLARSLLLRVGWT